MKKIEGDFLEVKPGLHLQWPAPIYGKRGGPGTVVRSGDPLAQEQLHVLRPAPEGAKLTPHSNVAAMRQYQRLGFLDEAFDPSYQTKLDVQKAQAKKDQDRILAEAEAGGSPTGKRRAPAPTAGRSSPPEGSAGDG